MVALRVRATPERAFEAFTMEVGQWWRPDAFFRFTPKSPGVPAFEPGPTGRFIEILPNGKVFEIGKILVWEPGARLVFSWRQASFAPDQDTQVEVRFEAVDDGARVTVEHRGWDSVPNGHVARHGLADPAFLVRHGTWWRTLLAGFSEASSPGPAPSAPRQP
jgi:uncharacterized protein YndB with AHSA1/START domain